MNTAHRRQEIISILIVRRRSTANELAQELGVSIRTIHYDIEALSLDYPIYTKQGDNGGVFISDSYNPYINLLSYLELQTLRELVTLTEDRHSKVLIQIIHKYGPCKVEW